jgi:hypothetical protein
MPRWPWITRKEDSSAPSIPPLGAVSTTIESFSGGYDIFVLMQQWCESVGVAKVIWGQRAEFKKRIVCPTAAAPSGSPQTDTADRFNETILQRRPFVSHPRDSRAGSLSLIRV